MAKKHKKNKKWIARLVFLLLFVAAAVVAYLVWDNYFNDNKLKPEGTQEQEQVEEKKNEGTVTEEVMPEKTKTIQYDGDDPNAASELSGVVTYAGVAGENLMIRVNIDQYLEDGECALVLSRGGNAIYNSIVRIIDNVTTSTCGGFDIPVSGLGNGKADIVINLSAGEKTGVIKGEVEI